jgi:hypothetical protein
LASIKRRVTSGAKLAKGYAPVVSSTQRNKADRTAETNTRAVILALLAVLVAIALFWVAMHDAWFEKSKPLQATLEQVAGLIVATGLLSIGWELLGKRRFAAEVLAKAKLSADVTESGLRRVTDQYLEDVEWGELFAGASHLDLVVAYARTWRNHHAQRLRTLAAGSNGRIRVFLPDPDDQETMTILAGRFDMTVEDVSKTVEEAVREYSAFDRKDGGAVEVWVRPGDVLFSCYRFDSKAAVLTLYSHSKKRRTSVPTFVVGSGRLFRIVSEELDAIQEQSRRVYPEAAEKVGA